jgi:ribosomal protein S18 acetylase RimI-like enzyme
MRWQTYSPALHERFAQTILASYGGSLDCPGLNGIRDIEDVIAGHKATGEFDPRLWFLLESGDGRDQGAAAGVLLLSRLPHADNVELVYLGLTPAARGKGLGDVMMRQALHAVAAEGLSRLSLAVDSTNTPALHLYYRHGMQRIGSRVAMIRALRRG